MLKSLQEAEAKGNRPATIPKEEREEARRRAESREIFFEQALSEAAEAVKMKEQASESREFSRDLMSMKSSARVNGKETTHH